MSEHKDEIYLLIILFLVILAVLTPSRDKEARAEVKEALELVKKTNALCEEAK